MNWLLSAATLKSEFGKKEYFRGSTRKCDLADNFNEFHKTAHIPKTIDFLLKSFQAFMDAYELLCQPSSIDVNYLDTLYRDYFI